MASVAPDETRQEDLYPELHPKGPPAPVYYPESNVAFEGALKERPALESTQSQLYRMLWGRRMIEEVVEGAEVWVEATEDGEVILRMNRSIPQDIVPWNEASESFRADAAALWGETAKMGCPSFDLPAGDPSVGGSCPAAVAGQSHVEPKRRTSMLGTLEGGRVVPVKNGKVTGPLYLQAQAPKARLTKERLAAVAGHIKFYEGDEGVPDQWRQPICQGCYASFGKYKETQGTFNNVLKYAWVSRLMTTPQGQKEFIEVMVASMKTLQYPIEPGFGGGIKPVRLHSSGDFFSLAYAECWVEIADRVYREVDPEVCIWAPTRSWAQGVWEAKSFWPNALRGLKSRPKSVGRFGKPGAYPNLVVRASAYHMGDPAPGAFEESNAVGTSSVFAADNQGSALLGEGDDQRFDIGCPVYATKNDANTCQTAIDPITKQRGCRMCWRNPEIAVNFTAH